MTSTGRVPLWLVATVGGIAAITVMGIFIYGSYSGIGSSL
uniref:Photosystem II reaction center protein J n=1 Tax=Leiomenia cribrosa TaxID=217483 RepID=A0A4D6WVQ1_9FLOR|nr:photosystem II protein J [Leiomenia cribrosa]